MLVSVLNLSGENTYRLASGTGLEIRTEKPSIRQSSNLLSLNTKSDAAGRRVDAMQSPIPIGPDIARRGSWI